MNRVQIYSAILGLLVLLAGALYNKGYWNTWDDYRAEIASKTNDCYANVVVSTGKALGCQPWNDPEAAMKRCTANIDPFARVFVMIAILRCGDKPNKDKTDNENSDNL